MLLRSMVRGVSSFACGVAVVGCAGSPQHHSGASARALSDVGTVSFEVVDESRRDPLASALPRAWMVQVFYPSHPSVVAAPYLDDPALLEELIRGNYYETGEAVLRSWARLPAVAGARARPATSARLPVVTLAPGLGFARLSYAHLAAALTHRGYAVVVIDHPYIGVSRLPDGRLLRAADDPATSGDDLAAESRRIAEWGEDLTIVLDRLAAGAATKLVRHLALDLDHVIASGHSIGGTTVLDACGKDSRIAACIDFEGRLPAEPWEGARKPALVVLSRSGGRPPSSPTAPDLVGQIVAALDGDTAAAWVVKVTGGSHTSYSDAPRMMPATLSRFGGTLMSADRSMALYSGLVDAFARAYARGGRGAAEFAEFLATAPETDGRHAPETP
jgi:dienelactone hydrolase